MAAIKPGDESKIESGYRITVFEIKSGEMIVDMSVEESAASSAHELVEMLIKSHQRQKRRTRMKLE